MQFLHQASICSLSPSTVDGKTYGGHHTRPGQVSSLRLSRMISLFARDWRNYGSASRLGLRQPSTAATETSAAPPSVRAPRIASLNAAQIHFKDKLRLDSTRDNDGAKQKEVRVGRGHGSGCGKTSGRRQKGQCARTSVRLGFEGGQTPRQKRLPRRQYFDPFERKLALVTLGRIQHYIEIGRSETEKTITICDLWKSDAWAGLRTVWCW